ncbi:MAG: hypothetical protein GVY24_07195 [Planctomycetes bacterium]|jgi:hypothetical protein|nr:hypothetical protein [Planctomycetota bacterium]
MAQRLSGAAPQRAGAALTPHPPSPRSRPAWNQISYQSSPSRLPLPPAADENFFAPDASKQLMKRIFRQCLRALALCLIVLGLLVAVSILFSPSRYYQYHVLDATPTQSETYAYADSYSFRLGVINGFAGGFYWEKEVGRDGGPARVLTNGWFPDNAPLKPGARMGIPADLTANATGNRINLTIAESKLLGDHGVTHSLLLPLWLWSLLCLTPGLALMYLTRRRN